jgi:hypothetical protein
MNRQRSAARRASSLRNYSDSWSLNAQQLL